MNDIDIKLPSDDDQQKIVDFLSKVGLASLDPNKPIATPALDLTETTKKLIAWGGAGGAGASIVGFLATEYQGGSPSLKIAFVVALAVILAAAALALAKVLDGDVRGRSAVAVAQYEARREILTALLKAGASAKDSSTATGPSTPPLQRAVKPTEAELLAALGSSRPVSVKTAAGTADVVGQRWTDPQDGLQVLLSGGDWVSADRVESYYTHD